MFLFELKLILKQRLKYIKQMIPKKIIFLALVIASCKSIKQVPEPTISILKIDTLLIDKISIRAIEVTSDKVYYAANENRVGIINLKTRSKNEIKVQADSLKIEFRSCAKTASSFFALSISNPALLYQFSDDLSEKKLVYKEVHENVFYDSMKFYDDKNGIAIGDPIDGHISIITTKDGGQTWIKNVLENSPKLVDGEAFFAASNTNIVLKNNSTFLFSGGKKAQMFISFEKGKTWATKNCPIIQGEAMTGVFTADFYNDKIGIIAGGNYDKPLQNSSNKAITIDSGNTWTLVANNQGFGYSSCVQFFPKSKNNIISVGLTGIHISSDFGTTWTKVSTDETLYTVRFIDKNRAIAAGKNKIIQITFQ